MEYMKIRAFSIRCSKCTATRSVDEVDFKNYIVTCHNPECKNQFTVYEGIKNGLKSFEDNILSPNTFLANNMLNQIIDIKIGYDTYFELPENTQKIYKINIRPMGNFLAGAVDISKKGFRILTSLAENGNKDLIGESGKIFLMIHAKTDNYNIQWMDILQYALEMLRDEEYLTSILFSEIAFEIYIDMVLSIGYKQYGLDDDSISRFLVAAELPTKVNPLMWNLYNAKLSKSKSWKNWESKALKWRNEIAHGSKVNATKDEAIIVYETVVDSIFYFMEEMDKLQQGNQNNEK